MDGNEEIARAIQYLQKAESIILVSHVSPDVDTIGSVVGLMLALRELGKTAIPVCEDGIEEKYDFLPYVSEYIILDQVSLNNRGIGIDLSYFDIIITIDSSMPSRFGKNFSNIILSEERPLIINIDHHETNQLFGDINLVYPEVPSTSVIVSKIILALGVPLNEDISLCLLAGLVSDTRSFRTTNVTPDSLRLAANWMESGASLPLISSRVHNILSYDDLQFVLRIANQSEEYENGKLLCATITKELFEQSGRSEGRAKFVLGMLQDVKGVMLVVLFLEREHGEIKVSLRSESSIDVAFFATQYNGGGNPRAASFIQYNFRLDDLKRELFISCLA